MLVNVIISLFLLIHVISDFYLQSQEMAEKKKTSIAVQLKHTLHVIICSSPLLIVFGTSLIIPVAVNSIAHFFIDLLKVHTRRTARLRELYLFLFDQLAHLAVIVFVVYPLVSSISNYSSIVRTMSPIVLGQYPFLLPLQDSNVVSFIVLALASFLFLIRGGTILTLLALDLPLSHSRSVNEKKPVVTDAEIAALQAAAGRERAPISPSEIPSIGISIGSNPLRAKYGKVIGNVERLIIVVSIFINSTEMIIGLIAIKSIGRFKELDKEKFGDYYIVGTLASFSTAIIIGILLKLYYSKIVL